jgi:hypothetical protein
MIRNPIIRVVLTTALACAVAPAIGATLLAVFEGHGVLSLWLPDGWAIPFGFFAPIFVLPFTVPAAVALCLGSWWLSRRHSLSQPVLLLLYAVLGLTCSLLYPAFVTVVSLAFEFDTSEFGVTERDQFTYLVEHWLAAGITGIAGGLLLRFVWSPKESNKALDATSL